MSQKLTNGTKSSPDNSGELLSSQIPYPFWRFYNERRRVTCLKEYFYGKLFKALHAILKTVYYASTEAEIRRVMSIISLWRVFDSLFIKKGATEEESPPCNGYMYKGNRGRGSQMHIKWSNRRQRHLLHNSVCNACSINWAARWSHMVIHLLVKKEMNKTTGRNYSASWGLQFLAMPLTHRTNIIWRSYPPLQIQHW